MLNVPLRTTVQLDMDVEQLLHDVQQAAWNDTLSLKRKTPGLNNTKKIGEFLSKKRKAYINVAPH